MLARSRMVPVSTVSLWFTGRAAAAASGAAASAAASGAAAAASGAAASGASFASAFSTAEAVPKPFAAVGSKRSRKAAFAPYQPPPERGGKWTPEEVEYLMKQVEAKPVGTSLTALSRGLSQAGLLCGRGHGAIYGQIAQQTAMTRERATAVLGLSLATQ